MRVRVLASAALFLMVMMVSAPWLQSQSDLVVPHFNATPPVDAKKLPAILTKDQLWGGNAQFAYQTHAYELAAKIPKVIYQQPCYCYCDRHAGHGSLLDCYTGKHAADCGVCLREGLYAYEQTKKGKTAAQIREGIEKGEWRTVDMTKYQTPVTAAK